MSAIEQAAALVDDAHRICILTGAGISTDSGIPDFRGPNGVWTKNPGAEKAATIQNYVADPQARQRAWRRYLDGGGWIGREPNDGHRALVRLEVRGKLDTLITQNVDGLHARAGTTAERLVEIHGTMAKAMCLSCDRRWPITLVLERLRAGETDPHCLVCGGILKSATISFGQALVPEVIVRAMQVAGEADLMLAVGSTLQVYPVAGTVEVAQQAGARIVIMNDQPTPLDHLADALLRGPIGELLPQVCAEGDDASATRA